MTFLLHLALACQALAVVPASGLETVSITSLGDMAVVRRAPGRKEDARESLALDQQAQAAGDFYYYYYYYDSKKVRMTSSPVKRNAVQQDAAPENPAEEVAAPEVEEDGAPEEPAQEDAAFFGQASNAKTQVGAKAKAFGKVKTKGKVIAQFTEDLEEAHEAVEEVKPAKLTKRMIEGVEPAKLTKRMIPSTPSQKRAIPAILHFNHKKNFFLERVPGTDGLRLNIQRIIDMHPGANVSFSDDVQCRSALARAHSEELASWFDREPQGCYRSDLCRLAALYEQGGYYFDNDFEVVTDVRGIIPPGVSVSTVMALTDRGTPSIGMDGRLDVFQAFLAAAPKHPVIKAAMDYTLKWYQRGEYLYQQNGQRLMLWNHPRRDGPCETVDPERCHQVLAGAVFLGKAIREWLGVNYLRAGHMDEGKGCQWTGDMIATRCAYLFTETDDLKPYNLHERNKETGWPRCGKEPYHGWCNIAVVDGNQQFGWSRSPEAAEFEGYEEYALSLKKAAEETRERETALQMKARLLVPKVKAGGKRKKTASARADLEAKLTALLSAHAKA
jgi:hypothetical protein